MKKVINFIAYVFSFIFVVGVVGGCIFLTVHKNNRLKEIPSLSSAIEEFDIPVIEINGNTGAINKEDKVNVDVKYHSDGLNFTTDATIKWQGNSSLFYEKKNYNITFIDEEGEKNKIKICDEWGKQNKYCLKANYIDYTSARNVVSAKIYGQIVHSRSKTDEINALVNGGAIDGFPVIIYMNEKYQGLYTMNIPKDKWMFDMGKEGKQAILQADDWSSSVQLKTQITDLEKEKWDLEHCSTEETEEGTGWVTESFNELIDFVNKKDGAEFVGGIGEYTDIDRTIDTMLYTLVFNGHDNLAKNILWATYDGQKWIPSVYDLDSTWGLYCDGHICSEEEWLTLQSFENNEKTNMLFKKVIKNFKTEIKERYFELRASVLSEDNIVDTFSEFISQIPTELYKYESILYWKIPSQETSNLAQISYFAHENLRRLDGEFSNI